MLPYFIFKGISCLSMGVMVNKLPQIIKASRNIDKIVVPGRDGFLTQDYETFASTTKQVECTLTDIAMLDQVLAWLDGSGEVIFSNQNDRKFIASIINQIPLEKIIRKWYKFILIFDCQPFAMAIDNPVVIFTSPGILYGAGTYKSKPIITIYGNGIIYLTINSNTVHLTNVNEYVTIDSELMDAYRDTVLCNNQMLGDFPELVVGENTISWVGDVSSVQITPNWRWL